MAPGTRPHARSAGTPERELTQPVDTSPVMVRPPPPLLAPRGPAALGSPLVAVKKKQNILWGHHRSNADMARLFVTARVENIRRPWRFRDVRRYCMFVGYPRSGHSLVGSLLDAHPNIVIAQEADALKFVRAGFGRRTIYPLLLRNSKVMLDERGREWSGYSYHVPGQWQGRYEKLTVIGDKKAGRSTDRLIRSPQLLDKLQTAVGVPLKLIHVVRNPFDNIATLARAHKKSLDEATDFYFALCDGVLAIKQRATPQDLCEVHLESLIADAKTTLRTLCDFLEVSATDAYLESCAAIVYESPNRTRHKFEWSGELIDRVKAKQPAYPYLSQYTFDS